MPQTLRFEKANTDRLKPGAPQLPVDRQFLQALDHLPDCCGVALGFDRLMILRHQVKHIQDILPFSWEEVD